MIRYSEQTIEEDDIKKVKDVLKSKFLTSGPISNQFEKIICKNAPLGNAKRQITLNFA